MGTPEWYSTALSRFRENPDIILVWWLVMVGASVHSLFATSGPCHYLVWQCS